jgi:hypothetical protein
MSTASSLEPTDSAPQRPAVRRTYLKLLALGFALFNSCRMLAYVPTLTAIAISGDSSQHSLWTWSCWLGANLTTAAWLYEDNGGRMTRVAAVNLGNASMCLIAVVLILTLRL